MPGVLFWTEWLPLEEEVAKNLSDVPGVYEVKVERRLVDYPTGRSAMIYYGKTEPAAPGLREVVLRDWFTPDKATIRANWAEYGPIVFRWAAVEPARVDDENARRNKLFVERFGRLPWGNPEG
ncbi:MAG TPA: hypothetical protein VMV18_07035 [bacterium]|nr:hypothetical protein [bacterium]